MRRQHRQCAGSARHRRQDSRRIDQHLRRSRSGAGARGRDQAAETPRGADRKRGQGAAVERAGQARRRCAAALSAIGVAGEALRPRQALSVSRRDGAAGAQIADRKAPGDHRAARAGRAQRAGYPRNPAVQRAAHLRRRRHIGRPRPLDRGGNAGRIAGDLGGAERGGRQPPRTLRPGLGDRAGAGGLPAARPSRPGLARHGFIPSPAISGSSPGRGGSGWG